MCADRADEEVDIDIGKIIKSIPHRYPFLLVDRIEKIIKGEFATGIKNVTITEPFFQGHFPSRPVMPGVLIIESMAQTAAILVMQSLKSNLDGKLVYFMSIENARFRHPVVPGDQLKLNCTKVHQRQSVWKFKGEAFVKGTLVAESTYSAMIVDEK